MRRTGWGKGEERWEETQKSARYRLRERERKGKQRKTDLRLEVREGDKEKERQAVSCMHREPEIRGY